MPACIFCAIGAGSIPATVVLETPTTMGFRDVNPKSEVHVLVIPKEHFANAGEVAVARPELIAEMMTTATRIAELENVADTGYRVIFNTGTGGGQTVFHAHLHLLAGPRLPGF